ncbi:class I adenylate cyclase [Desulfoplanes sp.]
MDFSQKTITTWIEELRTILASDDFKNWERAPGVVAGIVQGCQGASCEENILDLVAECRILLARLATRTGQCALAFSCGQALVWLGRVGRMMALDIFAMAKWNEQEVFSRLDRFTQEEKLLIMHQALAEVDGCGRQVREWAEYRLDGVFGYDPYKTYRFFAQIGKEGIRVPFLLLQVIKHGDFLLWFEGFLRRPLSGADELCVVSVLYALDETALVFPVGSHFDDLPQDEQVRFCRVAAELGQGCDEQIPVELAKKMTHMEPAPMFAGLRGLFFLQWPRLCSILEFLIKNRSDLAPALARFSFFLPTPWHGRGTGRTLGANPDLLNRKVLERLCRIDPDGVRRICLQNGGDRTGANAREAIGGFTRRFPAPVVRPKERPSRRQGRKSSSVPLSRRIIRLFAGRRLELKEVLHTYAGLENSRFDGSVLEDRVVSKCTVKSVVFNDCNFNRTVFDRVRFLGCTLTGTHFSGCEFKECTFVGCRFDQGNMQGTKISKCRFEATDIFGSTFASSTFVQNTWSVSLLDSVVFSGCSKQGELVTMCVCRHARWDDCMFVASCMSGNVFNRVAFSTSRCLGVETVSSQFEDTVFSSLTMRNTSTRDTGFTGCVFEDLDSMDPVFGRARWETLFWDTRFEEDTGPHLSKDLDAGAVRAVLQHWRTEQVARLREQRMLDNNQRRLSLAVQKFGPTQNDFFRLLPCLLHSARFEEYMDLRGIPGCRIEGFEPDHTQMRLLDEIFPFIKERSRTAVKSEIVSIAALYSIGSVGTVAQNKKSDLDVWVCLSGEGPDKIQRARVAMKCDGLSTWAREEYGLEVHFFVMTMEEIRANNFGILSQEGSGSAQALLLKEEFYRTALLIAGKEPRWWVVCNGAEQRFCQDLEERSCDLGEIDAIPKEEFFGASLWQIVGSARNPYKSLLKLGLLEKYALEGASADTLLAERIKENLVAGKREVYQIDPYGLLYKELLQFYGKLGDKEGCTLLKESFHSKIRMDEIDLTLDHPRRKEEKSVLSFYFQSSAIDRDRVRALGRRWTMAKSMDVGEAMNRFMLGAYRRIRDKVSAANMDVSIRPEEMTALGRTISAYFSREPGKVRRMFFLGPEPIEYQELYFFTERGADGSKIFAVKARKKHEPRVLDALEVVRKDGDPIRLSAWLAVNNVYRRGLLVSGNPSLAPVSVSFLQGLLNGVLEVFPPQEVFTANQEELLEEKRVMKLLCFLKKGWDGDDQYLTRADVLYSTSWGELYSIAFDHPAVTVRTDPLDFFSKTLPCPLDWEAELYQYRPSSGRITSLLSR